MALLSPRTSGPFDLLVFDAKDSPVLAAEVKGQPGRGADAKRWLQEHTMAMGISYGLVVDRRSVQLFDLTTDERLLELPTQALLECYAHNLDADKASERYLVLLTNTWLRNVMQPLASRPPPGIERLRELGVAARLRDGRAEFEWRGSF